MCVCVCVCVCETHFEGLESLEGNWRALKIWMHIALPEVHSAEFVHFGGSVVGAFVNGEDFSA